MWAPALAQSGRDRRLSDQDKVAIIALWQELSPLEYRPMKSETLGLLIGVKRQSAGRSLKRLVAHGYLLMYQPDPRAPRLFLLVNYVMQARAA
jgi:hypothetical protein